MIKGLLLLLLLGGSEKEYTATERYNDSLLIYNTYKSEIEILKTAKETDRSRWYQLDANNDQLTACAKLRLKKFNHQEYEPASYFERSDYGVARYYPKPGCKEHDTPQAFSFPSVPKFHFVVYDKQTRFLDVKNCAQRIPYILRLVYDKGRLLLTEKLNPITFQKLYADADEQAQRKDKN
ncbi:MAG: hypothetical protein U0T74_13870 [Chitinophagales bacterium]